MTRTLETTPEILGLINDLIGAVDGQLSSRSRVVDGLLDVRLLAGAGSSLQLRVDELLTSIPGLTTVPNGWWLDRLEELRNLATPA